MNVSKMIEEIRHLKEEDVTAKRIKELQKKFGAKTMDINKRVEFFEAAKDISHCCANVVFCILECVQDIEKNVIIHDPRGVKDVLML